MTESAETFRKVADQLGKMTAPKYRKSPITYETEVYRDLKIRGTDLHELELWLAQEFDLEVSLNPADYGPGEGLPSLFFQKMSKLAGRSPQQYKSLTVEHIVSAIGAGRWPA